MEVKQSMSHGSQCGRSENMDKVKDVQSTPRIRPKKGKRAVDKETIKDNTMSITRTAIARLRG